MNNNKTRLDEKSTRQVFYANQTNFFKTSNTWGTTSSDGTQVSFNEYGRMNFMVNFDQFHKYSQIKSIKIRVKSTSSGTSFTLNQEQTMDSTQNAPYSYHMADSNGYCEVDVINYCYASQGYRNYFSLAFLIPSTIYTPSASNAYKPQLIVEYIDDKESIVNQKMIEGTAGRALNYQVNARTGRPTYTKSLLNINTTVMPINLGLYYDPLLAETIDYYMPKGWRFTYDLSLTSNSEGYEYRDGNGLRHQFVKSLNNSNVYYDIAGTGLILTKTSNSYIIEDGYNNFITFDLWNHVTKVSKKIYDSNNVLNEFGLTFTYTTGTDLLETISEQNTISGVTTTEQKVVINYSSSAGGIEITSTGFPSIVIKKNSSNYLTQIIEEDSRISDYTYADNGLLETAYSDNGEKVVFTYDSRYRVKTITNCVNDEENVLNKFTFEYQYMATKITDFFNVTTVYSFNGEGELIGQYEPSNNEYCNMRRINKTSEYSEINIASAESYLGYEDVALVGNKQQVVSVSRTPKTNLGKGTLTLNTTDTFTISFIYNFDGALAVGDNIDSYVAVMQNGTELKKVSLSQYQFTETIGSFTFKCNSTSALSVKVGHNYNQGTFNVKSIRISQANMIENYIVTTQNTGDTSTSFNDGNKTFYKYVSEAFYYGSYATLVNKKMHYEDLVETKKNIKLNPSSYHLWYNKKRGLVANTTGAMLKSSIGGIQLSSLIVGTVTINKEYYGFNYSDYSMTNYLKVDYNTIKKSSNELTLEEKKINKNFKVIESVDSNDVTKQNTFDDYGNVLKEKVIGADSKYILKEYTYNKVLLLTEKTYIDGVPSIVTYTRNFNTGNIEKITYPDGLVVDYSYCDSTNGKLNKLSTIVDSVVNSNTFSYNKDKPSNYKGMCYGHSLSYDKYNMPYRHNNGSNYIWTINRDISKSGMVTITSFDTTGSFYIRETYDRFGNLILRQESSDGTSYQTVLNAFYSDLSSSNISDTQNPNNDTELKKNSKSKLRKVVDCITGDIISYSYDNVGKDLCETHTNTTYNPSSVDLSYDLNDRVSEEVISMEDTIISNKPYYTNDFTNEIDGCRFGLLYNGKDNFIDLRYIKDSLGRIITEDMTRDDESLFRKEYTYMDSGNNCSNLVRSITFKVGSDESSLLPVDTLIYDYDKMGRIVEIRNSNNEIMNQYYYDKLGRLIRENNRKLDKSFVITYDLNGNILSKKESVKLILGNTEFNNYTTKLYEVPTTYSASDIITKYNGQTITTTNPGNITKIGSVTYSWTRQHYLSQVYRNSYDYVQFGYSSNGTRTSKIQYQNGRIVSHKYLGIGKKILKETINYGDSSSIISYMYLNNSIVGFMYNGRKYIFKKNLQNDIMGIYDEDDNLVASYTYDAWGNHKVYDSNGVENTSSTFIGNINPFRYRSYYYDSEINLYYCNARYYNPIICRWISLDSLEYLEEDRINGCNLYAYCGNDPINYVDVSGHFALSISIGICISAAVIKNLLIAVGVVAAVATVAYIENETHFIENSVQSVSDMINDWNKIEFSSIKESSGDIVGGHNSNKSPSNKEKHQKGDSRRRRDQLNGEKGDKRRTRRKDPKKRIIIFLLLSEDEEE